MKTSGENVSVQTSMNLPWSKWPCNHSTKVSPKTLPSLPDLVCFQVHWSTDEVFWCRFPSVVRTLHARTTLPPRWMAPLLIQSFIIFSNWLTNFIYGVTIYVLWLDTNTNYTTRMSQSSQSPNHEIRAIWWPRHLGTFIMSLRGIQPFWWKHRTICVYVFSVGNYWKTGPISAEPGERFSGPPGNGDSNHLKLFS